MSFFEGYFNEDFMTEVKLAGSSSPRTTVGSESGAGASNASPSIDAPAFSPERLAELFDEGQNSSRACELHRLYVEGFGLNGSTISNLEQMVERVESR